jgi:uncharacterized Zn-finger protein
LRRKQKKNIFFKLKKRKINNILFYNKNLTNPTYIFKFNLKKKIFDLKKKFFKSTNENLTFLKFFFLKKFTRKKNIKRFILTNKNINTFNFYTNFELFLFNVLIRSNIVIFLNDSYDFIRAGFVFVNGFLIKNPYYKLGISDRVQLIVLKNYFYYLKTKLIFFARHLFKIKLKI